MTEIRKDELARDTIPAGEAFDRVGSHYWAIRRVSAPIRRLWIDTALIDVDNVPDHGPVILAANHLSFIDSPLLMFGLSRQVTMLGKAEYLRDPSTRWLFPAAGMIPVDRSGKGLIASLRCAEERLGRGEMIGLFPEGTRSRSGELGAGRAGVAHLALRTGAPIVPVGIVGSDRVQPPGARTPRWRGKVALRFGSPLDLGPWAGRRPSAAVRGEITAQVMASIAALSCQGQPGQGQPGQGQPGHRSDPDLGEVGASAIRSAESLH